VVALEGRRLDPALAGWRDDGQGVAVRTEVRDRELAAGDGRVEAEAVVQVRVGSVDDAVHVDVAGQALAPEMDEGRLVVRAAQVDLTGILEVIAVAVGVGVRGAERIAEDVGVDLAEVVRDLAGEPRDAILARVELAVRLGDVGEHLGLDRGRRQRERLERHDDRSG
jgi:hypothetical protein